MLKTHVYNDYRDMCAAYQIEPTTASGKDLSESFFVLFCLALLLKDLTNGTGQPNAKIPLNANPPTILQI